MSTVVKDLGAVSAYAYAVEKGYTGTEAEFAELMADYAEVGQRAEDAAESALNSKTAAQTAETTATNKASEATTAAQKATTKAGEAQTSAQTASSKASEASQSASQASEYAQTAETAKTDAQTAKTQADTARDEAVTAKTAAETAQGKAEDAQAAAESVAESIPSDYSQLSEDVSDLKEDLSAVEEVAFSEQIVIDMTDTADLEESNKIKRAHLYTFEEGKKYRLEVTVNNGTFQNASSHALLAQTSRVTNDSVMYLNTTVLDLVNTASSAIIIGHTYSAEFTALSTDKNILIRYKIESGSFMATVKCYEIGITIKTELDDIERKVDTNNATLTRNSRMQMGAHRGAESYAPPNSVAAYEIAGKMGFPWAWLAQIRWSSSGTLYVMHDADVSITTNGTGNIQDLTDEYINSLLCNKISSYDYSKFTDDDLRVPTLEKVIQICLRYGMKMCFRVEPFPSTMETEQQQLIWNNLLNLVTEYSISNNICCYSAYNVNTMRLCRTLFGDDAEICPYIGIVTAQEVVDWFNTANITGNRSVLLPATSLDLESIKLLHTNGIKAYAFTNSSTPTQEQMEQLAYWGVDILQNPSYARIPVV